MSDRAFFAVATVAVSAVVIAALIFGAPLRVGELFSLNPARLDVVTAQGSAQLIRQDATQRAILLVPRNEQGQITFSACAEPPPDVAQSIVHSLSSSLDAIGRSTELEGSVAAKISGDLRTAAELLFQRSQGIQLLRDTMFRLCEGFQNGVLTSEDYRSLIHELIATANFIIPFEQCAGITNQGSTVTPASMEFIVEQCLETAVVFNEMRLIGVESIFARRAGRQE